MREVEVGDQVRYTDMLMNKCVAFVAYKHSSTCVNLFIIDPNGNQYGRTSVLLGTSDNTWQFV